MQKNLSEFDIIQKFFKPLATNGKMSQDLSDDVAKIDLKEDQQLIISKDMIVQDVHFKLSDGAKNIAKKLLLSNLSDIASSGAKPLCYVLGFSKNKHVDQEFIEEFVKGLKSVQNEYKISLIGGDTVKSKQLIFSVTIFAAIKKNKNLSRLKAKNNDLIFISGSIGDAYIGLNNEKYKLTAADKKFFLNRHLSPNPRVKLGQELVKNNLSKCAADISDGLLADLNHICNSSNLGAIIHQDKIPFSKPAQKLLKKHPNLFLKLISAGDDYELIFSANEKDYDKIQKLSKRLDINLTCIGKFTKKNNSQQISLLDSKSKIINIDKYGYEH